MPSVKDRPIDREKNKLVPFIPDGDFYFTKGVEAFRKTKFQSAIKWLRRALEITPKNPLYQCQLSVVYTEIGFYHSANELLMEVLESNRDEYPDSYYLLANNYAHLGLLNEAKKYALNYLAAEPEGDFAEEADTLLELIDIDDEDGDWELEDEDELLVTQETIFHHMEYMEWELAMPMLKQMMSRFPDQPLTRHDYAQALFHTGKQEEAIQLENELLKDDVNSIYSYMNLAVFHYERDDFEASEACIANVLNVYPMHEQQKLRIAVALARTGHEKEACARFQKLERSPVRNHPSFFRWYSRSCYAAGQKEKAEKMWKDACQQHAILKLEQAPWELSRKIDENATF